MFSYRLYDQKVAQFSSGALKLELASVASLASFFLVVPLQCCSVELSVMLEIFYICDIQYSSL